MFYNYIRITRILEFYLCNQLLYKLYFVSDKSEFSEVTEYSVTKILTDVTESSFLLIENDIKNLYLNL